MPMKSWVGLGLGLSYGLLLVSTIPLSSAVVFGGDEGFELMKSYLLANKYTMYAEIWSDQPPLHTAILATVFRAAGTSVLFARLVTVLSRLCWFRSLSTWWREYRAIGWP